MMVTGGVRLPAMPLNCAGQTPCNNFMIKVTFEVDLSDKMVAIPMAQRELIARALDFYIQNHEKMIPSPTMEQQFDRNDIKTMSLMIKSYGVNVEITPEERDNFCVTHGFMDFPYFM